MLLVELRRRSICPAQRRRLTADSTRDDGSKSCLPGADSFNAFQLGSHKSRHSPMPQGARGGINGVRITKHSVVSWYSNGLRKNEDL